MAAKALEHNEISKHEPQAPRWLRWAQIAWVIAVAAMLLMYAAGSLLYYVELRQLCTQPPAQCGAFDYATAAGAAQLAARGLSLETYALLRVGFRLVFNLVPLALGVLIFARRRDEPMALLVSFFLVSSGTVGEAQSVLVAAYPAFTLPRQISEWIGAGIMLPLFFGLFPSGRMVPRLYWAVVAYFGTGYLLGTLGLLEIDSALGTVFSWTGWLSVLLGGAAAQIYRYRRVSTAVEKQQTRWVLFGMGAMVAVLLTVFGIVGITGDSSIGTAADPDLTRRFLFLVLLNLAFEVIYVSIGLAILRSKLFDIDVIIRKTLVYALLSAMLALVYFGSVVLLQSLLDSVSGQQSPIAIVISTLIIAALFAPLLRRVQAFIDRRFFRRKYNAQQILARFAQTARDEVSLDTLTTELRGVIQDTVEPEMVVVWLKERRS